VTRPWTVAVEGLVKSLACLTSTTCLKISPPKSESIAIAASKVVDGDSVGGFPLAKLLDQVQPLSQAKYVRV